MSRTQFEMATSSRQASRKSQNVPFVKMMDKHKAYLTWKHIVLKINIFLFSHRPVFSDKVITISAKPCDIL